MQKISLKARALRYLSAREHSRVELAKKLARHAGEDDDLDTLLDQLEAAKLLSDERFSESLVNRRAERFGNVRILRELKEHGIESDTFVALKEKLAENEASRALEVWRRKFNRPPVTPAERAKQMRFLMQRGFSSGAIQTAWRAFSADKNVRMQEDE
ncbi:MAG: recombination regulator RecX [Burkholderiaceae bacterium]|nr:recombination regulator RecX [Burkholderiaceae bacterium]